MPEDLTDIKPTLVSVNGTSQQTITWASFDQDLQHHMVSLGHSVLTQIKLLWFYL